MLNGGILDTDSSKIQDIKVSADGAMLVTQRGDSGDLVTDSCVLFADGALINTESLLTLTTPTNLQPDALYAVTIHNPSLVSDLTVEFLNLSTMITRNYPSGETKNSSLAVVTIPKTAAGLRDTHTRIIQGLFLGDSSKISVKNATALTAAQSQTITLGAGANDGTWKIGLIHEVTGVLSYTAALNHDVSNADLKTAIDALIAACGYTKSTDASAITTTISGGTLQGTPAVATLSASGTTIVPLMVGVNIDLAGSVSPVITQTSVGAIRVPIKIRKV